MRGFSERISNEPSLPTSLADDHLAELADRRQLVAPVARDRGRVALQPHGRAAAVVGRDVAVVRHLQAVGLDGGVRQRALRGRARVVDLEAGLGAGDGQVAVDLHRAVERRGRRSALREEGGAVAVGDGFERVVVVGRVDVLGADAGAGAAGDAGLADDADGAVGVRHEAADAEAAGAVMTADDRSYAVASAYVSLADRTVLTRDDRLAGGRVADQRGSRYRADDAPDRVAADGVGEDAGADAVVLDADAARAGDVRQRHVDPVAGTRRC